MQGSRNVSLSTFIRLVENNGGAKEDAEGISFGGGGKGSPIRDGNITKLVFKSVNDWL
jgi:hypothetical protein